MWTLADAKQRLSDRLGETSNVFWSEASRTAYINDAQRLIASVTRGIPSTVTGAVSPSSPNLGLPTKLLNAHPVAGNVVGGDALNIVPIQMANAMAPDWRTKTGKKPEWLIMDLANRLVYPYPVPTRSTSISVTVAVLPNDLSDVNPSEQVFNGFPLMEKYQNPLLHLAASYALLKERYDQDAERYFQNFVQEMQSLGVAPNDIPTFQEVRANAQLEG
jgi:hypothetical protein